MRSRKIDDQSAFATDAGAQIGQQPVEAEPALIDDQHSGAQLLDVGHVVGREQDRCPVFAVEAGKEFTHRGLGHDIKTDCRLIKVDDFGVMQQRGGEIAAHALAQ